MSCQLFVDFLFRGRKARDNDYTEDGKKWRWLKTSKQNETNKTKTNYV